MKKCKISPATLARTAALALALTNQVLSATGHRVLPIESAELEQLVSTGLTIATAESCTGGMIAQRLTNVSGASEVFGFGFVTYAEAAKQKLLGVDAAVIEKYNVVSGPVAAAMAFGAARESGAELAVGITGLAGPGGDEFGHSVGTVFIGYQDAAHSDAREYHFSGDREAVRNQTIEAALRLVLEHQK